jgi:hypothetical protein
VLPQFFRGKKALEEVSGFEFPVQVWQNDEAEAEAFKKKPFAFART